jgi:hypothetical protein
MSSKKIVLFCEFFAFPREMTKYIAPGRRKGPDPSLPRGRNSSGGWKFLLTVRKVL